MTWNNLEHKRKKEREYYAANRESRLEKQRERRRKFPEEKREYERSYYAKNRDVLMRRKKLDHEKNKDKYSISKRKWYLNNIEKIRENKSLYYKNNKEKIKKRVKERYVLRRDDIIKYGTEYQRKRYKSDPIFKFKNLTRSRISAALKSKNFIKRKSYHDILGCSPEFAIQHIESMFSPGMNLLNHGQVWEIDHKIPLASAKTEEEVIRLCHYTNLQPLMKSDNRSKGCKI